MFVIVTRNFPPSIGGMQSLMGDLALNFSEHGPVKVFADADDESDDFDKNNPTPSRGLEELNFYKNIEK